MSDGVEKSQNFFIKNYIGHNVAGPCLSDLADMPLLIFMNQVQGKMWTANSFTSNYLSKLLRPAWLSDHLPII